MRHLKSTVAGSNCPLSLQVYFLVPDSVWVAAGHENVISSVFTYLSLAGSIVASVGTEGLSHSVEKFSIN